MSNRTLRSAGVWLIAAALTAGCATDVKRQPVELNPAVAEQAQRWLLRQDVQVKLDSGYTRTIRANTEFVTAGRIGQGLVLRPAGTVLTVEGAHVHEAYAVVQSDRIVGFYLPVERAFSSLPQAAPFPLVERK
jgi:hypothetical protein